MNCWFWNIDRRHNTFLHDELVAGRLRQGWGYQDELNLTTIQEQRRSGPPLSERQQAAWKRCKDMVTRMEPGDLVVVKNVPNGKRFSLVEVRGEYRFDIDDDIGDQGHILPVEYHGAYHKSARDIPTPMVRALNRARHPIRRTLKHKDAVLSLVDINPVDAIEAEPFKEQIERWRSDLADEVRTLVFDTLEPRSAERLVREMLRNDGLAVDWTAGPNERGADLETEVRHGYGLSTSIAIQVKFHRGTEDQLDGLKQIERAYEERDVDAGLLVTFADHLSDDVEAYLTEIQRTHPQNTEVLYGEDLYTRLLELIADSEHEIM